MGEDERLREFRFSLNNPWSQRLFLALCRSKGHRPYRHPRMRRTSVCVRVSRYELDREDSTGIYKHGDQWLLSMRRLQRFNTLPEQVVIPVRLPAAGERRDAANQMVEEFTTFGALTVPIEDEDALLEAARVA